MRSLNEIKLEKYCGKNSAPTAENSPPVKWRIFGSGCRIFGSRCRIFGSQVPNFRHWVPNFCQLTSPPWTNEAPVCQPEPMRPSSRRRWLKKDQPDRAPPICCRCERLLNFVKWKLTVAPL